MIETRSPNHPAHDETLWVDAGICYHPECMDAKADVYMADAHMRRLRASDESDTRYLANGGNLD